MESPKTKVVLLLGAGFSAPSDLLTTRKLSEKLLDTPVGSPGGGIEEFISATIKKFWEKVFGWMPGMANPSLEDHFTQIDMATKSGHNLGCDYDPTKLHAIRRLTIHRVLCWLKNPDSPFPADCVDQVLRRLLQAFDVTIITTNWDTHVEWILDAQCTDFNYGVEQIAADGRPVELVGNVSLLKLHGCVNMAYCDCCQQWTILNYRLLHGSHQAVVKLKLLLNPVDFLLLGGDAGLADLLRNNPKHEVLSVCSACHARLGTRIATFTYRKDLQEYHAVWDAAKTSLQLADKWLFAGYSMPEADVEVRHLLKSTQLARREPAKLSIDVVLKEDCEAAKRYERFFGLPHGRIFQDGIGEWAAKRLDDYCR